MKPVMQTNNDIPGGNCLQACIASIMELPLESVPNFCWDAGSGNWFRDLCEWAYGMDCGIARTDTSAIDSACLGYCILGVKLTTHENQEVECYHAIVGEAVMEDTGLKFRVVHDPHPEPKEITNLIDIIWIIRNAA